MSMRASGRRAVADVLGTPRVSRSWFCAVPARHTNSIAAAKVANRIRARTPPFSAPPRLAGKPAIGKKAQIAIFKLEFAADLQQLMYGRTHRYSHSWRSQTQTRI